MSGVLLAQPKTFEAASVKLLSGQDGLISLRADVTDRFTATNAPLELLIEMAFGVDDSRMGVRLGNWLTAEQARMLWQAPDPATLKGKRDRALLAILLGCGLRRREVAELDVARLERREDHWAIVDLMGKGRHVRTVPVPEWVKAAIDSWLTCAGISDGRLFRCVCRAGKTWGDGVSERVVWHVVKECAKAVGIQKLAPHDLRRTWHAFAIWPVVNSNRSNFSSGTSLFRQRKSISVADNVCEVRSTIGSASSRSTD